MTTEAIAHIIVLMMVFVTFVAFVAIVIGIPIIIFLFLKSLKRKDSSQNDQSKIR
jgi:hypothetical protein